MKNYLFALSLLFTSTLGLLAQSKPAPAFDAVYKLLQENAGLEADALNAAAVHGLLGELDGRASLVTDTGADLVTGTNLLGKAVIYEKSYAYLRIAHVEQGLSEKIAESIKQLGSTNKLHGVILDLRFANGHDYQAAAKTADLFVSTEHPLINWGAGSLSASPKTTAISGPCAILVNSRTRGAAEALAAALRESRAGLLIGGTTAGQASVFKEFALPGGQALRIASSPVKVGKNKTLGADGVKSDIELKISLEDERAYLKDPYQVISRPVSDVSLTLNTNESSIGDTNRARPRINEAELVRRKREGLSTDEDFLDEPAPEPIELHVIRDPALARALDLLKGLTLIQASRGK